MKMNKKNESATRRLLGQAIRALRKSQNLTLLELANAAGSDPGNISRLERGLQGYSDEMLKNVCDALGVKIHKLYEMIESPQKAEEIAQNYDKQLQELTKIYKRLSSGKRKLLSQLAQGLDEE
jgi:transcriptional regulator with XRE-family HTH domain